MVCYLWSGIGDGGLGFSGVGKDKNDKDCQCDFE